MDFILKYRNFKQEYRRYKIAKVLGKEYKNMFYFKIIQHLKKTVINPEFKKFASDKYRNIIFYGLYSNDLYLRYDMDTKIVWVNHKIQKIFKNEYEFIYGDILNLLLDVIKLVYGFKDIQVKYSFRGMFPMKSDKSNSMLKEI